MNDLQRAYVKKMTALVEKYGVPAGYHSEVFPAIVAQACLESNWGKSVLSASYHNHWGMKCGTKWKGAAVKLTTKEEYKPGELTTIKDAFRLYLCDDEGVAGYFDFIAAKRYANLKKCSDPLEYIELLKKDGWATSGTYVENVTVIYNMIKGDLSDSVTTGPNLEELARNVIAGKYGNGARRRAALGAYYRPVQEIVNRMLKG